MSLIERRRLLLAQNKVLLPKEYQQVEYIETVDGKDTNAAYINTFAFPNQDTKVETSVFISQPTSTKNIAYSFYFGFGWNYSSGQYTSHYGSGSGITSGILKSEDKFDTLSLSKEGYFINDVLGATNVEVSDEWEDPTTFLIGAYHYISGAKRLIAATSGARIAWLKYWDGKNLLFDFIPCYRKSDGAVGMYDTVNKTFHSSNGEKEFIKGGDV